MSLDGGVLLPHLRSRVLQWASFPHYSDRRFLRPVDVGTNHDRAPAASSSRLSVTLGFKLAFLLALFLLLQHLLQV